MKPPFKAYDNTKGKGLPSIVLFVVAKFNSQILLRVQSFTNSTYFLRTEGILNKKFSAITIWYTVQKKPFLTEIRNRTYLPCCSIQSGCNKDRPSHHPF